MLDGYKIVCATPAGRRRYLGILSQHVLSSSLVDEYQLWENTTDENDIKFFHELQALDSRVKIVKPAHLPPGSNASIRQFYRHCIDEHAIYIRLDDDVVYMEPHFFAKFLRFRIDNPQYFVVFPNIINNAVCTYLQAMQDTIDPSAWIHPWCMDPTTWGNPHFAEQLHRAFLYSIATQSISRWHFGPKAIALSRYSVNCVSWFGAEFAEFEGAVSGDEEEYLSVIKPTELARTNCIFGDAVVAHFAFHPQREYLDSTNLLSEYRKLAEQPQAVPQMRTNRALDEGKLWVARLLETVDRLTTCSLADLESEEFITELLQYAGLLRDRRLPYGADNRFMNTEGAGLWQIPRQMARFLRFVAQFQIERVVDVGTATGWTITILTAFLARYNPNIQVITLDAKDFFKSYPYVKDVLPMQFYVGKNASDFASESFDLAFIDADHSYDGCRADYDAVGRRAALCAFHDINDKFVAAEPKNQGGVPRFWNELRAGLGSSMEVCEFLDHSQGDRIMGIGLLVQNHARRQQEGMPHGNSPDQVK